MLFTYQVIEREIFAADEGRYPATIVEYKCNALKIHASTNGVSFEGHSSYFTSQEDLDEFYKVMQWALRHHQSLKATGAPLDQDQLTAESLMS